jgi:hypothetical protein
MWVVVKLGGRAEGRKGGKAEVVTGEGRAVEGRVVAINPKAEFTPKVALTEKERADLMFGVKVEFARPAEAPHAGMWVVVKLGGRAEGRKGGKAEGRKGGKAEGRKGGKTEGGSGSGAGR